MPAVSVSLGIADSIETNLVEAQHDKMFVSYDA
jgi:hypothetical protein